MKTRRAPGSTDRDGIRQLSTSTLSELTQDDIDPELDPALPLGVRTLIADLRASIDDLNRQLSAEYSIRRDLERRICELERELG